MRELDDRTPVSIITGFLGSGKTTLLNHLLQRPEMAGAAVIINEFGEIGLDHLLVATPSENTVLLSNGCLCCTVRGDLVETLGDLHRRRCTGAIPPFDRILIETTGLADPVPIIQTVVTDEEIAPLCRLDAVVTLVDAVNGAHQFDRHAESVKQAAVADRLLLTKTDLAGSPQLAALIARLARVNPGAEIFHVRHGEIAPGQLFGAGMHDAAASGGDVSRWLRDAAFARPAHDHHAHGDGDRHDDHIRAFCIYRDEPVSAAGLTVWLNMLAGMRGANLLRMKGLLNVDGTPVAVHVVQMLIHEPVPLPRWPDDDRRSRLVFIARDMERAELEKTLAAFSLPETLRAPRARIDPGAYAQFVAAMQKFR